MFDKIRKGLSEAAKELKQASQTGNWKEKLGQLAADNPQIPLSGLVRGNQR